MEWRDYLLLIAATLSFLLHIFGLKWMKTQRVAVLQQKYFLINLSIAEMGKCLVSLIYKMLQNDSALHEIIKVRASIYYLRITNTALHFPLFAVMFLLTQDRFFAIYLHMKYPGTWYYKMRNKLISVGWLLCGLYIVVVTSISEIKAEYLKYVSKIHVKLFPSLSILLILQFCIVYGYIVVKIWWLQNGQSRHLNNKSILTFVIVISYVIFKGIPDIALMYYGHYGHLLPTTWAGYHDVGTRLNILTDALMYIYMQSFVREKIRNSVRSIRSLIRSQKNSSVATRHK